MGPLIEGKRLPLHLLGGVMDIYQKTALVLCAVLLGIVVMFFLGQGG